MSAGDPRYRVRSAFADAARSYDKVSRLYDEVGRRLLDHLDPIATDPTRVLDVGCGTGTAASLLASRFRRARIYAVDCAQPMLEVAKAKGPKFFSRQRFVCANAECLPVADHSIDLVHANLLLPWCSVLEDPLRELARVLAPGGLVLLSSLGPDTLMEMRQIWAQDGIPEAQPGLLDMHDLGDALVASGLVDAVIETERLTVRYPSAERVIDDLVRSGAWAARIRGPSAGRTRERFARLRRRYLGLRAAAPVDITLEIVYAHAWAPVSAPTRSFVAAPLPVRRHPLKDLPPGSRGKS